MYRIIPSAGVNTAATEAPTTSMFGSYPDLFLPPEAGNHRPRRRRLPRRCRDSGTSGYDNENSDLGDLSTSACEVSSQLISRDSGGVLVPSIEEVVREFEGETTDHMSPKKYHCKSSSSSIRSGSIAVSEGGSSTSSRYEEKDSLRWVGGQVPSPLFASHRAWCLAGGSTLNLTAMRAAAAHLEGEHDFSTFRGPDCHVRVYMDTCVISISTILSDFYCHSFFVSFCFCDYLYTSYIFHLVKIFSFFESPLLIQSLLSGTQPRETS